MAKYYFVTIEESDMKNLIGINETADFETQFPELVKTARTGGSTENFTIALNKTDLPPVTELDIDL